MHVFQTCGVPPSLGRIILPIIGWTRKRMNALMKSVAAYSGRAKGLTSMAKKQPPGRGGVAVPTNQRSGGFFLTLFLRIGAGSGEAERQATGLRSPAKKRAVRG